MIQISSILVEKYKMWIPLLLLIFPRLYSGNAYKVYNEGKELETQDDLQFEKIRREGDLF